MSMQRASTLRLLHDRVKLMPDMYCDQKLPLTVKAIGETEYSGGPKFYCLDETRVDTVVEGKKKQPVGSFKEISR